MWTGFLNLKFHFFNLESKSELFTGDASKDNHSPGQCEGKLAS